MVRNAIIKGILSAFRKIKARSINEMTGTERMIASNGRNSSCIHSLLLNRKADPTAANNEIDIPAIPRNTVAMTD